MLRPRLFGIRNPFTIIVIFTILSILGGLLVRAVLSSPNLKMKIESSIAQNMKHGSVQVGAINLSLANGLLPDFSLRISQIEMLLDRGCLAHSRVRIEKVRVPYRFFSLFLGAPHWGRVSIADIGVDLSDAGYDCLFPTRTSLYRHGPRQNKWSDSPPVRAKDRNYRFVSSAGTDKNVRRINLSAMDSAAKYLQGLYVGQLRLRAQGKELVGLSAMEVGFKPGDYKMRLTALFNQELTLGESVPPLRIVASATADDADIQIDGRWREGVIGVEMYHHFASNKLDVNLAFKNIPVAPMSKLLKSIGMVNQEFQSHNMWVSCVASASGKTDDIGKKPWRVKKCELVGESAELNFSGVDYVPETGSFSPFEVNLEKLDFIKVISAIGGSHPSQSLGKLGTVHGKIKIENREKIKFAGSWKGLELIFSNRGFRQTQKVPSFELFLQKKPGRVGFTIDKVVLDDGLLKGTIDADLSTNLKNGRISFDLPQVKLTKEIEKLMLAGSADPMSLQGYIDVIDEHITSAEMKLAMPKVTGDEMEIENAFFEVSNANRNWKVDTMIKRLKFEQETRAHKIFMQLLAVDASVTPELSSISGTVVASDKQLMSWSGISAGLPNDSGNLKTTGGWDLEGQLRGTVETFYLDKVTRYELSGSRDEPVFQQMSDVK